MHQQHATVQMSAITGVPHHVSQELPEEQNVYEAKVCLDSEFDPFARH